MSEHLLMADVLAPDGELEAEPVLIDVQPDAVTFTPDDGAPFTLERTALLEAVQPG